MAFGMIKPKAKGNPFVKKAAVGGKKPNPFAKKDAMAGEKKPNPFAKKDAMAGEKKPNPFAKKFGGK